MGLIFDSSCGKESSKVPSIFKRVNSKLVTSEDVDGMSNEEVKGFLEEEGVKALKERKEFPFGFRLGSELDSEESSRGESSYALSELFNRRRTSFIEVVWNIGKSKGMSDDEIVKKLLVYYHRHLISTKVAMRDIETRLKDLRSRGRIS